MKGVTSEHVWIGIEQDADGYPPVAEEAIDAEPVGAADGRAARPADGRAEPDVADETSPRIGR